MKLPSLLTPRGSRPSKEQSLALPLGALQQPADCFDEPAAATPRTRSKLLGKLGSLLTPRARGQAAAAADSPASSGLIAAYRPTLTGLMEHQLRLRMAQQEVVGGGGSVSSRTSRPTAPSASALEAESDDAASDSGSDLSSLDGFGDYARQRGLGSVAETEQEEGPGSAAAPAADPDRLPSPRQLMAPVAHCTPRATPRDTERAAEDLRLLLQAGELPGSRQRTARMLLHADAVGPDAFAGLSLHGLGFERCAALLLQLLLPLPLNARSAALAQLQSKLASQLLSYLGTSLERVMESERACQRFCRLPFEVAAWLLEHAPCDRGETLFDLGNLWLEQQQQQRREPQPEQQRALAALVWRRPLAADFMRCMAANLPWAAQFVAASPLRPARLPPSLDGRFSFTAEFDIHDLLELQQSALAAGRPQQQQSPAIYCGGMCWWAVLVANPRHNRFELYASCAAFSLFQEPFRASLQPAADVRFSFQGTTSLVDWRQTDHERREAMHTHWGGPAFWVPPSCPSLLITASRADSAGSSQAGQSSLQLAAAARPDTARGPRPSSRQMSRLSIASGAAEGGAGALTPAHSSRSLSGPASSRGSRTSGLGGGRALQAYLSDADSAGMMTARQLEPEGGLVALTMDQTVAEVRRSCPYSWGASLRVRVNLKLLGA